MEEGEGTFAEIWQPPYDRRAIILSVFNFFQTFGYYGFAAWVPTLLIAKGITITASLLYSFIIAIANPVGPLLGTLIADRMERKWQVCARRHRHRRVRHAVRQRQPTQRLLIVLGVLVTLCNNWMSFSFHNYQSELFPTRIRSRAVGFVYSWSRLSAALSGLVVAYLLAIGRRECCVRVHRLRDGDRGDLHRRVWPTHTGAGAGGYFQRLTVGFAAGSAVDDGRAGPATETSGAIVRVWPSPGARNPPRGAIWHRCRWRTSVSCRPSRSSSRMRSISSSGVPTRQVSRMSCASINCASPGWSLV